MSKYEVGDYVEIVWFDAHSADSWVDQGDVIAGLTKVVSVGKVIRKSDRSESDLSKSVTLAQSHCGELGQMMGCLAIPLATVFRSRRLLVDGPVSKKKVDEGKKKE